MPTGASAVNSARPALGNSWCASADEYFGLPMGSRERLFGPFLSLQGRVLRGLKITVLDGLFESKRDT